MKDERDNYDYVVDGYNPLLIKSNAIHHFFGDLDNHIVTLENSNKKLKKENEELNKKLSKHLSDSIAHSNMMMGNVLKAMISTPSIESLGVVGATVISKISDMTSMKEVRTYINQIREDNKEELESLRDKVEAEG